MYEIVVAFTVEPEHRADFVEVALRTGRDALANEPGTHQFELIADEADPNRFYLHEGYDDADAFGAHVTGEYFGAFFADARPYSEGPEWLMRGTRVEQQVTT